MLRHFAGVAEIVDDLDEALRFYQEILGLEIAQRNGDDYAMLTLPGVFHFGVWNRTHAAECVFGDRKLADRIPLGFTLEMEADSVDAAAARLKEHDWPVTQKPRTESWGQKSVRFFSPGGSLMGLAETPWAREIKTQLEAAEATENAGAGEAEG